MQPPDRIRIKLGAAKYRSINLGLFRIICKPKEHISRYASVVEYSEGFSSSPGTWVGSAALDLAVRLVFRVGKSSQTFEASLGGK